MTPQSTFMITAPIGREKEADLRQLLSSMNMASGLADPHNSVVPFYQFAQLHVARFVIIETNTNEDIRMHGIEPTQWRPTLAFIGDIDGGTDIFLAELVIRAGSGLRQIFSHCQGFISDHANLLVWLQQHNNKPVANYIHWIGRTVRQIHQEETLRKLLKQRLTDFKASGSHSPEHIHQQLAEFVQAEVAAIRFRLSPPEPTPPLWFMMNLLHLIALPLIGIILLPLLIIGAPFYFVHLRKLENSDLENVLRPEQQHLRQLNTQEDVDVSNQFNVFGQVKPGRFRLYTIRASLLLLNYACRHIYKRGYLTRVTSIHFARWVLLDDNKRLYFASNYDGSADTYMDDFINKVAWGINLVFSNGVGYPKTRWLIKEGGSYEQKYKRTLRRNQIPSQVWYKAYPGLTAIDLARNSRIRQGLETKNLSGKVLRQWLELL